MAKPHCETCFRPFDDTPLSIKERVELDNYRAKAQLEALAYYRSLRNSQNAAHNPASIADMQKAQNVNLHARDLSDLKPEHTDDFDQFTKLIFRQMLYFLLVMAAIGVGLAVFL